MALRMVLPCFNSTAPPGGSTTPITPVMPVANNGNDATATTSVTGQNDENRYFPLDQVDDIKVIPKQFAKG